MGKVRNNSIDGAYLTITSAQRQSSWIEMPQSTKIGWHNLLEHLAAGFTTAIMTRVWCEQERAVGTNWIEIHCNSNLKWLFWSFEFAVELIENQRCRSNSQFACSRTNSIYLTVRASIDCFDRICLGLLPRLQSWETICESDALVITMD